ncbi:MAG: hypothetical protein U9Q29_07055 [Campylobacterota bacterium]|nr:hypothetical protein [Campylobacterota bacterium]
MKKTLVSLATASLLASGAMAADKGIDIVTTGQAAVYYETHQDDGNTDTTLFDKDDSAANVGIQLNLDADLKNNFTFGSQITYLGTAGIEHNLVGATRQTASRWGVGGVTHDDLTDEIALTKIFIAKKIGNTTVKIGRQELPKSLSPFAFSESWNVFKNTFEAILVVNSDIPDTTLVGAYVSASNSSIGNISAFGDIGGTGAVGSGGAYLATVQNKSIPMATVTASYYDVAKAIGADGVSVMWGDVAIAGKDLPMGLKVGIQGGTIQTDTNGVADTTAYGVKVGLKPIDALALCVAYTSVDGDDNKVNPTMSNVGTGVKTPLYTQMLLNQNAIKLDADTFLVKGVYNTGDYGKIIAQYTGTTAGKSNVMGADKDYNEFDLVYKVKAAGVNYLLAYINRTIDKGGNMGLTTAAAEQDDRVRIVARYNF